ncbi:MAG: RNA 2',3'-cyclic phosphodiesterase [Bacillota bacterium]
MRLFIAIALEQCVRAALAAAAKRLAATGADVKWVEEENLHLTLKFLGEVEAGRIETLTAALTKAAAGAQAFTLSLDGLGSFPGSGAPRVVWARVYTGAKEAAALAARVEQAAAGLGFPREERSFSPHVTLGRRRTSYGGEALATAIAAGQLAASQRVDEFVLYRSDLRPAGPVYTRQAVVPLPGAGR